MTELLLLRPRAPTAHSQWSLLCRGGLAVMLADRGPNIFIQQVSVLTGKQAPDSPARLETMGLSRDQCKGHMVRQV